MLRYIFKAMPGLALTFITTYQYGICPKCSEKKEKGREGIVERVAPNSEGIDLACKSVVTGGCRFLMWKWDEKKRRGYSSNVWWRGKKQLRSGRWTWKREDQ